MKNTLKKIMFLIIVLSLNTSCVEIFGIRYFNFKNNSNKPIYDADSYSYPDTSLTSIGKDFIPGKNGNTGSKLYTGGVDFVPIGVFAKNPTMQIFIFDADVIENTPWDTIVKYNMVLKRYQFTRSDLEKMNWEVIYDGK